MQRAQCAHVLSYSSLRSAGAFRRLVLADGLWPVKCKGDLGLASESKSAMSHGAFFQFDPKEA